MTPKKLASLLNGRQIGKEITKDEEKLAFYNELVVIFGASDDLVELRGAINNEVGAYGSTMVCFLNGELLERECEDETCPHEEKLYNKSKKVLAEFGDEGWNFTTSIPHETFNIMEEDQIFCKGIILHLRDLQ